MLKRRIIKKIFISSAALFACLLICLIPSRTYETTSNIETVDKTVKTSNIYLLNKDNLLGRTSVVVNYDDTVDRAYELLDVLISDGAGEGLIPAGFSSIIPSDTSIISVTYENNALTVNFSKELLNVSKEHEEAMIEAIVYTLTSIDDVNDVIICVEGNQLTTLPKTNIVLPTYLNRNYGINKQYDINSLDNVTHVTTYYIDKTDDGYYYVPVTKYLNDNREKIEIIIEELEGKNVYDTNLMSFLNSNTKLLSESINDGVMELAFNNYILNDFNKKDILEEVIYTICLSIKDNYDVKEVVFNVDNKEVYKSVLKEINN